jgi:hypothetical protein
VTSRDRSRYGFPETGEPSRLGGLVPGISLVAGGCPRSTTSDLRGDKHAGRRARTGQCIRRLPTQLRAVQVARPQKLDVTATFGLQTRRYCWSQDLHYAAAQALHYSIPLLRAWSPEKRPAPGGPRGLRVSMESGTQISACLSTERFQSLGSYGSRSSVR